MQFRGGMNELMRQAARMQRKIDQLKQELQDKELTASAAGDKVSVTATYGGKITRIAIDPAFLAQEGLELACDAAVGAANAALASAAKAMEDEVAKVTGGVKLPNAPG
jgi:DNA-binding YbaB/EbfC family protein